jgi:two-component system chemotaxis sensor kinase CheA
MRSLFCLKGSYAAITKTLIVKVASTYVALLADEIIGEQQAVLKPLGNAFGGDMGITAVTQHGNGNWAYMLNIRYIFDKLKTGALATTSFI